MRKRFGAISPGGFSSAPPQSKKHPIGVLCFGAGGGTRTHMMLPSADFESATSTNSITPAYEVYRISITETKEKNKP